MTRRRWHAGFTLAYPVMAEQVLRTLMRTTDIVIAGLFSPTAVAAVGLADVYARIPLQVGLGVGDGAIALSSQDTGSGAVTNRDEAVAQALVLGFVVGLPLSAFGLVFDDVAIAVLGADADVVSLGAGYLAIVMVVAPASILTLVGARAIQGTGDTITPMLINGGANVCNILGSVALAFGVGPFPELSIVGVALASAAADVVAAALFVGAIYRPTSPFSPVRPTSLTLSKQLVAISWPRTAEGCAEIVAEFPFNAILLAFGTEVNAAYHVGRRMYQQIAAPLSRGFSVAANVLVGQALGGNDPERAYYDGAATTALAVLSIGAAGVALYAGADGFVRVFTDDPETIEYATAFAQVYALAAFLIAAYVVTSGSLRGGSDTITPFVARLTGTGAWLLGISYVGGVVLGYGVLAVYVAIVADYLWRTAVVATVYHRKNWLDRARALMVERGSVPPSSPADE